MAEAVRAVAIGGSVELIRLSPCCRSRLLGEVPESVLDRDQYICNQVHLIYAFDVAYKFHQVAFDVSQEPFVGLRVHVMFLSFGSATTLEQGARDCFGERERDCRRLNDLMRMG
jgi:hypothetical protein